MVLWTGGAGWSRCQFLEEPCCPSKHIFFDGGMVLPIATSLLASFFALNAFSFAKAFPWALEVAFFLGLYVAFTFKRGATKISSKLGDVELRIFSFSVVAPSSSSVDEDGKLMVSLRYTRSMPRGGLRGLTISLLRV